MRLRTLLVFLVALSASGCLHPTDPAPEPGAPRSIAGTARSAGVLAAPLTVDEFTYEAPNATGAWGVALWMRTPQLRACEFRYAGVGQAGGGTWDTLGVVAKGWKRPEVLGAFDHDFRRSDGYVGHAGTSAANQSVKQPAAQPNPQPFQHRRRIDLPTEALVVIGNTQMASAQPGRHGLNVTLDCDGPFQLLRVAETSRLLAYGPEDFEGTVIADTTAGFGGQRGASKSLLAQSGFIVFLHEDGNEGNAEYTTTRPDGTTQTDAFGNRAVVGGAGAWKFALNRVSPSPRGEFRLFALDVAPFAPEATP